MTDRLDHWTASLEARHLADLRFAEVTRALRALSSTYVQNRQRLKDGAVFSGAGKRAAFALFYGPLHFLLVREILRRLTETADQTPALRAGDLVDLGCGTGAAGAAWADALEQKPRILAIDRHPWALQEAAGTYREFGLSARTVLADVATAKLPPGPAAVVAAFTLNEMPDPARETLLRSLVDKTLRDAGSLLVVEPLAGFVAPWWKKWAATVEEAGGRADEWRFRLTLPPIVAKLDRAAGLNHREQTARSLSMGLAGRD